MSYADEIRAHTRGVQPNPSVPTTPVDRAALDQLYEGRSADGRVRAYVTGRLEFDHVEIDDVREPEVLAGSVVEAVNLAMSQAQAPVTGGGSFDADADAEVARFDALLERMDADLDDLGRRLDDLEGNL